MMIRHTWPWMNESGLSIRADWIGLPGGSKAHTTKETTASAETSRTVVTSRLPSRNQPSSDPRPGRAIPHRLLTGPR